MPPRSSSGVGVSFADLHDSHVGWFGGFFHDRGDECPAALRGPCGKAGVTGSPMPEGSATTPALSGPMDSPGPAFPAQRGPGARPAQAGLCPQAHDLASGASSQMDTGNKETPARDPGGGGAWGESPGRTPGSPDGEGPGERFCVHPE